MTAAIVFLIVALVLFVLAAIGVGGNVNLTAAGLACCVVSALAGGFGL